MSPLSTAWNPGAHQQGRFPFDPLVKYDEFEKIERACAGSKRGKVNKPVLRIS